MWRAYRPIHLTEYRNSPTLPLIRWCGLIPQVGGFSAGLTTLPCKKTPVQEPNKNKPRTYRFNGKTNGHRKQDLLFGTWNVRTM